jgi:uncharacterized membrane protein YphA (DoxX/SURF4 family)
MNSQFTTITRILLGLILVAFGINKLYEFIPLPEPPRVASELMASMANTGYVLNLVAIFEIIIGLMLIFRLWVPFVLLILAPLSLNILLFHLFLHVPYIGTAILVVTLNTILIYKYRHKYKPLFITS